MVKKNFFKRSAAVAALLIVLTGVIALPCSAYVAEGNALSELDVSMSIAHLDGDFNESYFTKTLDSESLEFTGGKDISIYESMGYRGGFQVQIDTDPSMVYFNLSIIPQIDLTDGLNEYVIYEICDIHVNDGNAVCLAYPPPFSGSVDTPNSFYEITDPFNIDLPNVTRVILPASIPLYIESYSLTDGGFSDDVFRLNVYCVDSIDPNLLSNGWYQSGYDDGVSEGEELGYNNGYNEGKDVGEQLGYNNGYNVGYTQAQDDTETIKQLIFKVIDTPFQVINNVLNFELFGVNLSLLVYGIITVGLIIFVVRYLF